MHARTNAQGLGEPLAARPGLREMHPTYLVPEQNVSGRLCPFLPEYRANRQCSQSTSLQLDAPARIGAACLLVARIGSRAGLGGSSGVVYGMVRCCPANGADSGSKVIRRREPVACVVARQGSGGRLASAAFEAGNHGLGGLHPLGDLFLGQAGAGARLDQGGH